MNKTIKSPFYVLSEFLSPLLCENIVDTLRVNEPDRDVEGNPLKMLRMHEGFENVIWDRLQPHLSAITNHYQCKYVGTEKMTFQTYPEYAKKAAEPAQCINSKLLRKKWVKVHDVDLTAVLWLKDYHDGVPLDPKYEVYGGKLEFPAYDFSLVPQRGTMVIHPAGPHFIHCISPILVGDLMQVRINISITNNEGSMWFYDPSKFPGKWQQWFEGMF